MRLHIEDGQYTWSHVRDNVVSLARLFTVLNIILTILIGVKLIPVGFYRSCFSFM